MNEVNGVSPRIRTAVEMVTAEFFEKPSWAQRALRYVLVCALVSSVIDSSCFTDYDSSASLNPLFLQDANGWKHTRDGTTSSLARAGCEIQTLCVQDSLIAFLVTSLLPRRFDEQHCRLQTRVLPPSSDSENTLQ